MFIEAIVPSPKLCRAFDIRGAMGKTRAGLTICKHVDRKPAPAPGMVRPRTDTAFVAICNGPALATKGADWDAGNWAPVGELAGPVRTPMGRNFDREVHPRLQRDPPCDVGDEPPRGRGARFTRAIQDPDAAATVLAAAARTSMQAGRS